MFYLKKFTNINGTKAWEIETKPFGENAVITGTGTLNLRFPGQYFDEETGLNYNGFRDYKPMTGRYMQADPIGLLGGINLFAYAKNSPVNFIDSLGLWPTKWGYTVHQDSIDRVLSKLSKSDRDILNKQQVEIDKDTSSANAYQHAMSAPKQDPMDAWKLANEFIKNELSEARKKEKCGQHKEALEHIGNAMHTLQDWTDPAHYGFQLWDENDYSSQVVHVASEFYDPGLAPGTPTIDIATEYIWTIFKSNKSIPKEVIPKP